jgi:hypothetical protein
MAPPDASDRLWLARARWRLRGATLWPAFIVLTFAEGVLISRLAPYERAPGTLVGAVLLAWAANLFLVAVVVPLVGRRLARRVRPDMPRAVADDVAGTVLLLGAALAWLVAGLAHRPAVAAERAELAAQLVAVHDYVLAQAPEHRAGLAAPDVLRIEPRLYRTCVPGSGRPLCLFVDTSQQPPGVTVDSDRTSNDAYRLGDGFD